MAVITPTLLEELPNEWRVTRWQGIATGDSVDVLLLERFA